MERVYNFPEGTSVRKRSRKRVKKIYERDRGRFRDDYKSLSRPNCSPNERAHMVRPD